MTMHRILTLARRVVQQLLADRRTLALIVIAPLVILTVAGILVRLEPEGIRLAVVQEDTGAALPIGNNQSFNLGDRLVDSLGNLNENINVQVLTAQQARDK